MLLVFTVLLLHNLKKHISNKKPVLKLYSLLSSSISEAIHVKKNPDKTSFYREKVIVDAAIFMSRHDHTHCIQH